jgi:hypothetical protein
MKLSNLKKVEKLNLKSIKLIKGGLSIDASKKKDVESTSSDTYKP